MCVITFYPISESEIILTSNRDESPDRPTLPPIVTNSNGISMLYPKDEVAGGTWIGASGHKRLVALMNGGFVPHIRKPSYKLSRGIIALRVLEADNAFRFFDSFDFGGIEPFTIIMVEYNDKIKLTQIVWDGKTIFKTNLPLQPKLWTSSPLYTPEMHFVRTSWFKKFISEHTPVNPESLWTFHHEGIGDKNVSMLLDWDKIHTKSITQLILEKDNVQGNYHDLETGKEYHSILSFQVANSNGPLLT